MKIEDMLKDPEKYHDNVRIKRPSRFNSFPIHWIKQIIKWNKEDKLEFVEDHLNADDWEVVDETI